MGTNLSGSRFPDFVCPYCKSALTRISDSYLQCLFDDFDFEKKDGIWQFLLPDRWSRYEKFIKEYEFIRYQEKRGSPDPEYYRGLPFRDRSNQKDHGWSIRSRSFNRFVQEILEPVEKKFPRPLNILDMGAGNCWLSNRLSARGHHVAAIDLLVNDFDGLGAFRFYTTEFLVIQAEFDFIPFPDSSIDIVIFNASFHYSTDYSCSLRESVRLLQSNGLLIILDTPLYKSQESGLRMIKEREALFLKRFGIQGNSLPINNFLTYDRLSRLGEQLDISWKVINPRYKWSWLLKRQLLAIINRRESAKFRILVGTIKR